MIDYNDGFFENRVVEIFSKMSIFKHCLMSLKMGHTQSFFIGIEQMKACWKA